LLVCCYYFVAFLCLHTRIPALMHVLRKVRCNEDLTILCQTLYQVQLELCR
jgi:hypothetical protein